MKAKTKAALISALLFPGLGHFVLKRAMRGCLFIVPTLLAIGLLLRTTLALADQLVAEIQSGALPFDIPLIMERISATGGDDAATNAASLVILVCWVGSIADAWWLERGK
jgi:TM2 domain-containing membrane protein YozV